MAGFLRFGVVRRLAWNLADLGIMREQIEEWFKRGLIGGPMSDADDMIERADKREPAADGEPVSRAASN